MEQTGQQRFEYFLKTITQWHSRHRETSPGTTVKIRKRFEKYAFDYEKHMAEYRKTNKSSVLQKANELLETAENEFAKLKKLELLGTLSK